jgi:crotonobetainyl-CoA:carnitine CoA-transferase CaiB-like acyl-CoA transferase
VSILTVENVSQGFGARKILENASFRAPPLGQDTVAVLREMGLDDDQLDALRRRGVLG